MSERLRDLLVLAAGQRATSVLFVVGNPPAVRVGGTVRQIPDEPPLRYQDTQPLAELLMTPEIRAELEASGAIEVPFEIGAIRGRVHIYYGQGSHNLVFTFGAS